MSKLAPEDPRHGSVNGYVNQRCRCPQCRKAWADYNRERGYGRTPAALAGRRRNRTAASKP